MPVHGRTGGVWQAAAQVHVMHGGVWKARQSVSGRKGGAWQAAPLDPPNAPMGLLAVADQAADTITLTWSLAAGPDETSVEVHRRGPGEASFTPRATLGANDEHHVDSANLGVGLYSYQVRACNGAGCSAFSNQDSASIF